MKCFHPYITDLGFAVPCGHCPACLKKKRTAWTSRMVVEAKFAKYGFFVTATIDDDHMDRFTYSHPDADKPVRVDADKSKYVSQCYFKRIRKTFANKGLKMKYYWVNEYGDRFGRLHFHGIFFLYNNSAYEKNPKKFNLERERDVKYYENLCNVFRGNWPYGIVSVDPVSNASIHYVTKYALKHDADNDTWSQCSKCLGSGFLTEDSYRYYLNHPHVLMQQGYKHPLPRYLDDILFERAAKESPQDYMELVEHQYQQQQVQLLQSIKSLKSYIKKNGALWQKYKEQQWQSAEREFEKQRVKR